MNDIYDVLIIGAGPAGSVFARELATLRSDFKIALIDGQTEKRKKPCGGLLSPDAQRVLAELDMTLPNSILADPQIFTVETIDISARIKQYYQRHYLNMDRYRFDRWLLSFVPDSVTVINSRVLDIKRESGFLIKLTDGEIFASLIVGADGGGSIVRRKLFGKMPKQYIAIQEWYESKGENMPYYSCIFDQKTSDSCSWTVHKNEYAIFGGAFGVQGCRRAFAEQKTRFEALKGIKLGKSVKTEACLLTSVRRFSDIHLGGDGYFLVGEAAALISPSSFEGISYAIISARRLAEAFATEKSPKRILRKYKKKLFSLRLKLVGKVLKRDVLCCPVTRKIIMKSGVSSIASDNLNRKGL